MPSIINRVGVVENFGEETGGDPTDTEQEALLTPLQTPLETKSDKHDDLVSPDKSTPAKSK